MGRWGWPSVLLGVNEYDEFESRGLHYTSPEHLLLRGGPASVVHVLDERIHCVVKLWPVQLWQTQLLVLASGHQCHLHHVCMYTGIEDFLIHSIN